MKAFANLPYWNKNFVGAGAFKVVEWDQGSRMELEAFNDFVLGRPKIDRMTFKTVEDTNTNLAAVLAGEVDFCMRSTISFDGAMILREQWEKQGKGKVLTSPASWTWLNLSRDNPWFNDVRVRRALLHAIDRDTMTQNIFKGERIISHFPMGRARKSYKKALATATIYKHDPERAKKLLAEAGWKPGADGVLVNGKGERMEFEFRCTAERRDHEQAQAIIADYWKKIGVRTVIKNMPNRLLNSAENRSRWPGAFIGSHNVDGRGVAGTVSQQKYSHARRTNFPWKMFRAGTIPRRTPSSTTSIRSSRRNAPNSCRSNTARCLARRCRTCRCFSRRKCWS